MKISKMISILSASILFFLGLCSLASADQKPDLTIVQMEVQPALNHRVAGSMVHLKAIVYNQGNAAAPPSKALIGVSTETKQMWVGALNPKKGQIIYLNVVLKNPATYTAVFKTDTDNAVNESDETNNEKPFTFVVRPVNPPDLIVKNVKIEPANPNTNSNINFSAVICNAGDEATPKFKTSIQIGGESTPKVLGPASISGPYCGQVQRIMKITEAGNYRVTVKADIDNSVPEANESDNEAFLSFTVKAAKPDLIIREMKMVPANPTTGDTITFSAKIYNIGTLIAPAGKAGIRVGGETNPVLYPFPLVTGNQWFNFARQMKLDKEGNYRVVFIADAEKTIDELDESNNEGFLQFTVRKK